MTILSSKPISQSAAHDFLAAYLDRATTDPALQPNAAISEHGPVSRTTAAAPNLILHNLKRVQAGLAGEVLGRDLTLIEVFGGDEGMDGQQTQRGKKSRGEQVSGAGGGAADWEDVEKWQQTNTAGGSTAATTTAGEEEDGDGDEDEDEAGMQRGEYDDGGDGGDGETNAAGGTIDKEDRKRKKKERRLAEKRAKAKKSA